MKTPELRPCPFCGGEAYLEEFEPHEHFFVELPVYPGGAMITCRECEGRLSFSGKDAGEKVIEAWNTRVYPKEVQETIDKNKPRPPVIHPLAWLPRWEFPHCPQCDVQVKEHLKHCWNCGQKLDWSEYNEVDKEATR